MQQRCPGRKASANPRDPLEDIPSVQIYPVFTKAQEERRKEAQDFSDCFFFLLVNPKKNIPFPSPHPPKKKPPNGEKTPNGEIETSRQQRRRKGNIQTCQLFLPLFGILGGGKGEFRPSQNFPDPLWFLDLFYPDFFHILVERGSRAWRAPRGRQVWIFAVFEGGWWEITRWESGFLLFPAGNRIYPFSS